MLRRKEEKEKIKNQTISQLFIQNQSSLTSEARNKANQLHFEENPSKPHHIIWIFFWSLSFSQIVIQMLIYKENKSNGQ